MRLCMKLIEKELNARVLLRTGENSFSEFCLKGWSIPEQKELLYDENSSRFESLLVMSKEMFSSPDFCLPGHAAVICAGLPESVSQTEILHNKNIPGKAVQDLSCNKTGSQELPLTKNQTGMFLAVELTFGELVNSVNRIFMHYFSLERDLEKAARIGRNIGGVTEACVPAFFDNLVVSTMDFHIIAEARTEAFLKSLDPASHALFTDGPAMSEFINFMNNDQAFADAYYQKDPFIYRTSLFPAGMLCMNVFYQGSTVCRLVHYYMQEPNDYDAELLRYIASYIQLIYNITGGDSQNLPRNQLQYVLMKLASGEDVPQNLLYEAMNYHRWKPGDTFACLCILSGSHNENGAAYFCKMINDEISDSCAFIADGYIACVVNLASYKNSLGEFMAKRVEFFRDNLFRAGISNPFTDPADLAGFWKQAQIALETGMQQQPSFWYHYFKDQVRAYMKAQVLKELSAPYLAAPELLRLKEYDAQNHTEYYLTLYRYLSTNMNTVETARELFIARGTMNFRLSRLKKITGLDLSNPDTRMYLMISYKLLEQIKNP